MPKSANNNRLFHCKPFSLAHHNASMRVGTDALLLGLFTPIIENSRILEIGSGSGIISMIIASRMYSTIDAIDIDSSSFEETKLNFSKSPFWRRMETIQQDFNLFASSGHGKYQLIISNPPFFINDLRPKDDVKKAARHSDSLTYSQICDGALKLLETDGNVCIVLPYEESRSFIKTAKQSGLILQRQQLIFPKRGLHPNRINMQFGFKTPNSIETNKFTIREEDGSFSNEYIDYLKDYYIALK